MDRQNRGFSLVELLVVISVIAILIGILLPTLSKARQSAYRTTCRAQLRDIGNQLQMYINESKGRLPVVFSSKLKGLPSPSMPDDHIPTMTISAALKPYRGPSNAVFLCPQDRIIQRDPAMPPDAMQWYDIEEGSYQMNPMLLSEVARRNFDTIMKWLAGPPKRDANTVWVFKDFEPFHNAATKNGSTNYLFADWHVSDRTD